MAKAIKVTLSIRRTINKAIGLLRTDLTFRFAGVQDCCTRLIACVSVLKVYILMKME